MHRRLAAIGLHSSATRRHNALLTLARNRHAFCPVQTQQQLALFSTASQRRRKQTSDDESKQDSNSGSGKKSSAWSDWDQRSETPLEKRRRRERTVGKAHRIALSFVILSFFFVFLMPK